VHIVADVPTLPTARVGGTLTVPEMIDGDRALAAC